jgi:hypothetical protein
MNLLALLLPSAIGIGFIALSYYVWPSELCRVMVYALYAFTVVLLALAMLTTLDLQLPSKGVLLIIIFGLVVSTPFSDRTISFLDRTRDHFNKRKEIDFDKLLKLFFFLFMGSLILMVQIH